TNRISKSASTPSGTVSKVQQIARDVGRNQTDMPNPLEESSPSEEAPPPKKSPERGRRETSRKPEEAAVVQKSPGKTPPPGRATRSERVVDLETIRMHFISAVGPIGSMLFDEAVDLLGKREARTSAGASALVRKLASEISDEAEAERFREEALG